MVILQRKEGTLFAATNIFYDLCCFGYCCSLECSVVVFPKRMDVPSDPCSHAELIGDGQNLRLRGPQILEIFLS